MFFGTVRLSVFPYCAPLPSARRRAGHASFPQLHGSCVCLREALTSRAAPIPWSPKTHSREVSNRVKGVSASSFAADEINFLKARGNDVRIRLSRCDFLPWVLGENKRHVSIILPIFTPSLLRQRGLRGKED